MRTVDDFHRDRLDEVLPVVHLGRRTLEQMVCHADGRACEQADPAVWFPPDGVRFYHAELLDARDRAAALCKPCPVRVECLAAALLRGDGFGCWGGVAQPDYQLIERLWRESTDVPSSNDDGACSDHPSKLATA